MTLSPQFLDELRARTTLSALIQRSVKLTRAGREWKGCCPFHNEKTPSFYVNDEKAFYHCFGCSAHGDAIRWLTEQQGLPFMDAVKELAAAAGMDLPAPDPRAAQRAERARSLHEVMAAAEAWFVRMLNAPEGAEARALADRRGLGADTARAFGIGFAPDSRDGIRKALAEFGDAMLVEAGLLIQVDGKAPYDRFRGRLMIPIRDVRGRTIAFGGRVIGDGEPKYLNSPDTPLFDKGRTLFNLDRAGAASRKADRVIAVEGYMDVIALAQAGFGEAVAPLGTALTEAQLERLWRLADVPLLAFDGDNAGQKAALRAAHRALPMLQPGRSLGFVTLPPGLDPDDLVRQRGPAAFDALLARPEPLVDRVWASEVAAEPLETPEQRAGLKRRLSELAGSIADNAVREEYRAEFRSRFDALFARSYSAAQPNRRATRDRNPRWRGAEVLPPSPAARAIHAGGIDRVLAKAVLAGLIRHPQQIARHVEALGPLRRVDGELGRAFEALVDAAFADASLDGEAVRTILAKSGFDSLAAELMRADAMPFSFTRKDFGDSARAHADLERAIGVLIARPEVEQALADATAAVKAEFTDEAFARQVALVRERQALEAQLANLMLADEEGYNSAMVRTEGN